MSTIKIFSQTIKILLRLEFALYRPFENPAAAHAPSSKRRSGIENRRVARVRYGTGILFLEHRPFVLSVMSAYIEDRHTPAPEVTRILYRYFEELAASNAYGRSLR